MKLENISPAKREKIRQKGLIPYILPENDDYLTMCILIAQFPDSAVIFQKTPNGNTCKISWRDFCLHMAQILNMPIEWIGNSERIYCADKMREIGKILEEIEMLEK